MLCTERQRAGTFITQDGGSCRPGQQRADARGDYQLYYPWNRVNETFPDSSVFTARTRRNHEPMSTEYNICLVLDGAKALEPIQKLQEGINANLASMGVDKRIGFTSRMSAGIITTAREMTEEELKQMRSIVHSIFLTSDLPFAKTIVDVELIRRKPGHVSQSAS